MFWVPIAGQLPNWTTFLVKKKVCAEKTNFLGRSSGQKKENLFSVQPFCTDFSGFKSLTQFFLVSVQNRKSVQTFFDRISLNTYFFWSKSCYSSSLRQYQLRKQKKSLFSAFLLTVNFWLFPFLPRTSAQNSCFWKLVQNFCPKCFFFLDKLFSWPEKLFSLAHNMFLPIFCVLIFVSKVSAQENNPVGQPRGFTPGL